MHRTAALVSLSLLLGAAAPPPLAAQVRPPAPPRADNDSPVRCKIGSGGYRPGSAMPQRRYFAAPPAPPPPPMVSAPALQSVVPGSAADSARMKIAPGYAATAPYGAADNRERYEGKEVAAIQSVATAPVSTFSVDVDTGAYSNVRRFLQKGQTPPAEAVRTEEMINYFRYDYPMPASRQQPFSVTTDVAQTPWNPDTRLVRIGLRGYDVTAQGRPAANLVFLVDVSGSMSSDDKLPLVKRALTMLADKLTPKDRVSIVVYAGAAGVVLDPTSSPKHIRAALDCLEAGGSTAGAAGIQLAYDIASANFIKGGINRIFVATDGDFNVGVSDNKALEAMVKKYRDTGVTLTTLGFGEGNYNEALMERIADLGNGNYAYIDSAMEAQKVLDDELSASLFTIAKDVKVQVEFNPAQVSQYRLIGYENRALAEEDFDNDAVDAGDIGAGHQVTAIYEVVQAGGKGWLPDRRYDGNRPTAPTASGRELAFVKLRYKLPGEEASRLIERPVPASLLRTASAPRGDMAFAVAVAALGQKLRGDKYLGGYSYAAIRGLAGNPQGYWRNEFLKLAQLAAVQEVRSASKE
ncbi:VWA domain-containing protein [Sphingomonas sp. R647]|uniref:vWA domain-containing protein n=1 Tax=Sphingomonas sp. R647 TaxID=2875233 RepID=UPI001CD45EF6|nr:VWA domain-containing protein [Sphingomonas sp. R647]MCA1200246.1 VWA domain-containing protein [Sphingomonas sp. R647]